MGPKWLTWKKRGTITKLKNVVQFLTYSSILVTYASLCLRWQVRIDFMQVLVWGWWLLEQIDNTYLANYDNSTTWYHDADRTGASLVSIYNFTAAKVAPRHPANHFIKGTERTTGKANAVANFGTFCWMSFSDCNGEYGYNRNENDWFHGGYWSYMLSSISIRDNEWT